MSIVRLIYTTLLLLSVFCAIFLIHYASKRKAKPGANCFIMMLLSTMIYCAAYLGEINSESLKTALFWFDLQHIAIPFGHYFWVIMSLEFSMIPSKKIKIFKYVLLYHPIIYNLVFFTNRLHGLYISAYFFESNGYFPVIVTEKGYLYMLMVLSGSLIGLIGMAAYVWGYLHAPRLHRHSYIIMITASLFPWVSVYLLATGNSYLGIDYYPVIAVVSGLFYAYGIFKYKLFNTIPMATHTVFRYSKESTLLVDSTDLIIEANEAIINLYPELAQASERLTLSSFFNEHPELRGLLIDQSDQQIKIISEGKEKYFNARINKIITDDGYEVGKILTLSDISLMIEYQKKLENIASNAIYKAENNEISFLQAQIKPHFINNTLSTIASMISRDPVKAKELIGNLGEYLANCCYFDQSSDTILLEKELEAVDTYVEIEKARFGKRLNYNLILDDQIHEYIDSIFIPRLILQPLVENAIRHGILKKADGGEVKLIISCEEDNLQFFVEDDGVGMSEDMIKNNIAKEKNSGIALVNINKRLLKYYGQGLKISSIPGKGTCISFFIPFASSV